MKRMCYFDNIIVILSIIASGTVVFSFQHRNKFMLLYFIVSLVYFRKKISMNHLKKEGFLKLIIILALVSLNCLINYNNKIYWGETFRFIAYIIITYMNLCCISFSQYKKLFVRVMVVFAAISLIVFSCVHLGIFKVKVKVIYDMIYHISYFHVVGTYIVTTRNSGLFWEPGMYQVFLNLALLFRLDGIFKSEYTKNKSRFDIIILIIAIISTKSTTGYIVMIVILITFLLKYNFNIRKKVGIVLIKCLMIIAAIFIVITVLNSNVVSNKFDKDNYSFRARENHIVSSIKLIHDRPIIGYGIRSDKYIQEYTLQTGRNAVNSMGVFVMVLYLGIPFTVLYYCFIYTQIKKRKFAFNNLIIFLIIIIFHSTEVFYVYPIASLFILDYAEEKETV